jgi:hypothetical protein
MMGILCTVLSILVEVVNVVLFKSHFIRMMGSFCREAPFMVYMERSICTINVS